MTPFQKRAFTLLLGGAFFSMVARASNWLTRRMVAPDADPNTLGEQPALFVAAAFIIGVIAVWTQPSDDKQERFWQRVHPYFFFILVTFLQDFRPELWVYDLPKHLLVASATGVLMALLFGWLHRSMRIDPPHA